jgi:adenine-specific DNA glycosylase
VSSLNVLLDLLETAGGPADPLPSTEAWELVLAENVAYLVDDERRRDAMGRLRRLVGIEPEQILAAPDDVLLQVVTGMQPTARVARLRRCAELAVAGAPWTRYPGIGKPGAERIALFSGTRAVLALDSNALRVLVRLGYGDPDAAYATTYRQAQTRASTQLAETVLARQRAHQLLRRHGQTICRRSVPACPQCPLADHCPSAHTPRDRATDA